MFGSTGEPAYQSPELLNNNPYDQSIDLWSVGIVLYQLLTKGNLPDLGDSFTSLTPEEQQEEVNKVIEELECTEELRDLVKSLLVVEPSLRKDPYTIL